MAFHMQYSEENAKICEKKLADCEGMEICYNTRKEDPILAHRNRIVEGPLTYKLYLDEAEEDRGRDGESRGELVVAGQVKQFLDEVFRPWQPINEVLYTKSCLSTGEIYEMIKKYTAVFGERTTQSFACWCRENKVDFLKAPDQTKGTIKRDLYVLKDVYHEGLIKSISMHLPRYQESLRKLKKDGLMLVGYARESNTRVSKDNRARLLRLMICNLKERSLVDRVYVSPCANASSPFFRRDTRGENFDLEAEGNTQDLLAYLKSAEQDICLVSVDYAGLTTRGDELVQLVKANPRLKKIAIENFKASNEMEIFDADKLIKDKNLLERFEKRSAFIHNRNKYITTSYCAMHTSDYF